MRQAGFTVESKSYSKFRVCLGPSNGGWMWTFFIYKLLSATSFFFFLSGFRTDISSTNLFRLFFTIFGLLSAILLIVNGARQIARTESGTKCPIKLAMSLICLQFPYLTRLRCLLNKRSAGRFSNLQEKTSRTTTAYNVPIFSAFLQNTTCNNSLQDLHPIINTQYFYPRAI